MPHMDLDEALDILDDGGEYSIYETPLGTKLSVTTPTGEGWNFTKEEREAAREVMGDYEQVAVQVYNADGRSEIANVLAEADVTEPWRVIGRVENIPFTVEEARELAESGN